MLIDHLEYTFWDEVWLFLVGSLEKRQAEEVIKCIRNHDPYLSARCLSEYRGKREDFQDLFQDLIDWLLDRINDEGSIEVLVKIADTYIEDKLIGLLKDKKYWVRISAAKVLKVLGEIKSEKVVEPPIGLLLKDKKDWVRVSAVWALGKISSEKAVEPLIDLLKDEDSWVREEAANTLGKIATQLNADEQSKLVCKLSHLATKDKKHAKNYADAITKIKSATGRRFIKELRKTNG